MYVMLVFNQEKCLGYNSVDTYKFMKKKYEDDRHCQRKNSFFFTNEISWEQNVRSFIDTCYRKTYSQMFQLAAIFLLL